MSISKNSLSPLENHMEWVSLLRGDSLNVRQLDALWDVLSDLQLTLESIRPLGYLPADLDREELSLLPIEELRVRRGLAEAALLAHVRVERMLLDALLQVETHEHVAAEQAVRDKRREQIVRICTAIIICHFIALQVEKNLNQIRHVENEQ